MSKKVKPLADRVIIEPDIAKNKTEGGIYIPDIAQEKQPKGKVIAVGNGTKDEPMEIKEGDTVIYGKFAGTEIKIEDKNYLIMRQCDILAII